MFRASSKQRRSPNFSFSEPLGVPDLPGKGSFWLRLWKRIQRKGFWQTTFSVFEMGFIYLIYMHIYIYIYPIQNSSLNSWIINQSFFYMLSERILANTPCLLGSALITSPPNSVGWNTPALGDLKITKKKKKSINRPKSLIHVSWTTPPFCPACWHRRWHFLWASEEKIMSWETRQFVILNPWFTNVGFTTIHPTQWCIYGCFPQNGWCFNNGKPYFVMDDLGVPLFLETPIYHGEMVHTILPYNHTLTVKKVTPPARLGFFPSTSSSHPTSSEILPSIHLTSSKHKSLTLVLLRQITQCHTPQTPQKHPNKVKLENSKNKSPGVFHQNELGGFSKDDYSVLGM